MTKQEMIKYIEKYKIIAICRGIYGRNLQQLVQVLYDGGIKLVEITFDQSDDNCIEKTSTAIQTLQKHMQGKIQIGAGTVITAKQVDAAYEAGAAFVLSPNVNNDIIEKINAHGMVSIPGAMTPSEIIQAQQAGADFIKLFPAGYLGTSYLKDVLGPIHHVKIIATAGITPSNIQEFMELGICGVGISGYLANNKEVEKGNFTLLGNHAKKLVHLI